MRQPDAGIALSPFARTDGNGDHIVITGYVSSSQILLLLTLLSSYVTTALKGILLGGNEWCVNMIGNSAIFASQAPLITT